MSLRSRTRKLACFLPSIRSSASVKGEPLEDDDDDRNRLIDDNDEPDGKAYNLSRQDEAGLVPIEESPSAAPEEQIVALNDSDLHRVQKAASPTPGMTLSDTSSATTWADMTQSFADLEMDHSTSSISGSSSITGVSSLKSASLSAPNSPHPSVYSTISSSSLPSSPGSLQSAPSTPSRRSTRLPLTTPLPRKTKHRRAVSASSLLLPMSLAPPPCEQVQNTITLLKSIKQQIRALKRRESHLSTTLHVQRRERQQMQEQIAHLEARRLRVEAMFVRPLPLALLLPVPFSPTQDEYDLCLVSEGQDSWNAMQPLIRIQLVAGSLQSVSSSSRKTTRAMLLHFGPTLTQPMAAAVTFVSHDDDPTLLDLQPIVQYASPAFWERATSGRVQEADANQLSDASCQFLFDALTEHKHLWRSQLSQVVDKKTRRIQWILQQEADSLYYEPIPSSPTAPVSQALVELD